MKWYNHKIYRAHKADLKSVERRLNVSYDMHNVEHIFKYVEDVARQFERSYSRIGVMDLNDVLQEGYAELLYAWTKLDWEKIEESDNPAGQRWAYLKLSIKRGMIGAIMDNRSSIRIPRDYYTAATKNIGGKSYTYQTDIFLSTTFTQMFGDEYFDAVDEVSNWDNDRLNDFLNELMDKIMTFKEKDVLRKMFGMDEHLDKKVPKTEIAEYYKMNLSSINKVKRRALHKLKLNKHVIENYFKSE